MSLAMVSALFFSCPFFMSIFAKVFLKEQIGIRRWSAITVGFIGVLVVLNPTLEDFNFFKLAPVACSLCYACSMTITKYTSEKDNIYTQLTLLYIFAVIASVIIFLISGSSKQRALKRLLDPNEPSNRTPAKLINSDGIKYVFKKIFSNHELFEISTFRARFPDQK